MNLLVLSLCAPLVAVEEEAPNVLHAVTMEGLVKCWGQDRYFDSACGETGLKLLGSDGYAVEWPPRVSSLTPSMTRCGRCHDATGRKRPRSAFRVSA